MEHSHEQIIYVHKKPTRHRGPTWTEDEVHKLFHVWNQPSIYHGFLSQRKKQDVFAQMSQELKKLGVERTWGECQSKIKNLKGEYKRAKEQGIPFKFYTVMENCLRPHGAQEDEEVGSCTSKGEDSLSSESQDEKMRIVSENDTTNDQVEVTDHNQSVHIEFELMSSVDFQNMKGSQLPIEIEGENMIPHEYVTEVESIVGEESLHDQTQRRDQQENDGTIQGVTMEGSNGAPLIVITTTNTTSDMPNQHVHSKKFQPIVTVNNASDGASSSNCVSYVDTYTNAEKSKRKLKASEISQKRRKLNLISDKMAETVERILIKTTNSLIDEMKASEDRFMKWEEKRREEEQKREELMLRNLVDAIKSKPSDEGSKSSSTRQSSFNIDREHSANDMQRIREMIGSSDDPCAVTFDLLATKLTTMLHDQSRETEESLMEWETAMQKKEMKHTDNLFKILISAVKSPGIDF